MAIGKEQYETAMKELNKRFSEQMAKLESSYKNKQEELEKKYNDKVQAIDEREQALKKNEDDFKKKAVELEKKGANLEKRELELEEKSDEFEAQLKTGVAQKKNDVINQYVEKLNGSYREFKANIAEKQAEINKTFDEILAKESVLAAKELELKEKENLLNKREGEILQRENDAANGFEALKIEKTLACEKNIEDLTNNFSARLDDLISATNENNKKLANNFIEYLNKKTEESEKAHQEYISVYGEKLQNIKDEIEAQRQAEIKKMNDDIEAQRKANEAILAKEKETRLNYVTERENNVSAREELVAQREADVQAAESAFDAEKKRIEGIDAQSEEKKDRLQEHEEELAEREAEFDEKIENEIKERFEEQLNSLNEQVEYYKNQVLEGMSNKDVLDRIEQIKSEWGEDPQILIARMNQYKADLDNAIEELNKRPADVVERYNELKEKSENLKTREVEIKEIEANNERLESENEKLRPLLKDIDTKEAIIKQKDIEILRLKGIYKDEATRDERISNITKPIPAFDKNKNPWDSMSKDSVLKGLGNNEKLGDKDGNCSENKWLDNISARCKDSGLIFNPRILKAFHTALKTAELSPLTVLAGVSGTGKSELPRLYSNFGGLPFASIAVQPNWDSPESMLGYFNSIDNNFDAKDVLKLLAQADGSHSGISSLNDFMSLILLDEMNLSNVELYFSDFLSKLESRRGCADGKEPWIDVKIGSGLDPFPLRLGRNVLWTGTMNQDETTKTLSDKVLDRGIVINFPSPKHLLSRKNVSIPIEENREFLTKDIWNSWIKREISFDNDIIKTYKTVTENINRHLNLTGRALGHRVWQSIEYYMANYPDVIEAMKDGNKKELSKAMNIAFEDQLVQKIMPKLRGLEMNSDVQANAIESIRSEIENAGKNLGDEENMGRILKDFDNAKECNYGSFMWCTSDYLNDEKNEKGEDEAKGAESGTGAVTGTVDETKNGAEAVTEKSREGKKKRAGGKFAELALGNLR